MSPPCCAPACARGPGSGAPWWQKLICAPQTTCRAWAPPDTLCLLCRQVRPLEGVARPTMLACLAKDGGQGAAGLHGRAGCARGGGWWPWDGAGAGGRAAVLHLACPQHELGAGWAAQRRQAASTTSPGLPGRCPPHPTVPSTRLGGCAPRSHHSVPEAAGPAGGYADTYTPTPWISSL